VKAATLKSVDNELNRKEVRLRALEDAIATNERILKAQYERHVTEVAKMVGVGP
jgi:hypothetical protein